ncbi:MAG TPA: NADPH-dependent F420 reductase [Nitrospirota bacterium]|nr:NADPH-dependent F420 reductase [Nitrospirota bacterium]
MFIGLQRPEYVSAPCQYKKVEKEAGAIIIVDVFFPAPMFSGESHGLKKGSLKGDEDMKTNKINRIGIVGSGHIGGNLGILLAKAGYEVLYSSRHPDTLKDLVKTSGPKACAGTVAEAIAFGDVIVLSLPLKAMPELDAKAKEALKGKIVIDTSNPYPERDGKIAEEARKDPGGMGVFVARLLPGARIVRAFNTVYFEDLKRTTNEGGEKIGIPIAGDDQEGLKVTGELVERAGLDPVVVGSLSTSKLFDVGTAVYATSAPASEIRKKLNLKPAGSRRAA